MNGHRIGKEREGHTLKTIFIEAKGKLKKQTQNTDI